jgi:hypothetical protein
MVDVLHTVIQTVLCVEIPSIERAVVYHHRVASKVIVLAQWKTLGAIKISCNEG